MKKVNFLYLFATLFLLSFSCEKPRTPKVYACAEYSIGCELKKDNILFKPIKFSEDLVDAYGDPVDTGEWYMNNINSNTLAPVKTLVIFLEKIGNVTIEYSDTTYYIGTRPVMVELDLRVRGVSEALLIMTGVNEFRAEKLDGLNGRYAEVLYPPSQSQK